MRLRRLIAETSTRLLDVPFDRIDDEIVAALERVAAEHQLDRIGLRWLDPAREHAPLVHAWSRRPNPWPPTLALRDIPWASSKLMEGKEIAVGKDDELSSEAEASLERLRALGTQALLILPLRVGSDLVGFLHVSSETHNGAWEDEVVSGLRLLGEVIAGAYVRATAVQALRDSERRYRHVVEDQTELIVRWTPDGTRTFVNEAYCRAFGVTRDEVIGTSFFPLIQAEDRERVRARLARISVEDPVSQDEHRVTLPDGSIAWQQWTDRGIFDSDGELVEMQSAGRDVTDRRHAEEELVHRAEFQTLVAEVSSRLLKARPQEMAAAIQESLARIGGIYDVDFCGLWWFDPPSRWVAAQQWITEPLEEETTEWPRELAVEDVRWASDRMRRGEGVVIETQDDHPPESAALRALNEELGIVSEVIVPILLDADVIGAFNAFTVRRARRWPGGVVHELQVLGEIVAAAHARASARTAVDQREAELARSQTVAGVGSYVYLPKEGTYTSSPELDAIHGLGTDIERTFETWAARVHPDDRVHAVSVLERVMERGITHVDEYRYVRDDGDVRSVQDHREVERDENGDVVRVFGTVRDITEHRETEKALKAALERLETLQRQLENENTFLREEVRLAHGSHRIIGESAALRRCLHLVERVAPTEATVLIVGETGTGKELIANAIHELSGRDGPMVSVNCAALPANLIESELFGYEKGAFTGAHSRKPGRLELADRGTLFLDEVGEFPIELQAKLLRVLQEGEYERLGGVDVLTFSGRLVAATNRDLEEAVGRGEFRSDLFYRLNVFPVTLPSLRERKDDIPVLAKHLVAKHAEALGRKVTSISGRMLDYMVARDWPGNVRELESFVQRALIVADGPVLDLDDSIAPAVGPEDTAAPGSRSRLQDVEREHIAKVLEQTDWVVEGEAGAAAQLGLAPSTLRSRMKKLAIRRGS